ncbi:hypothetical protein NVP2096O_49 [Vibrio phage 2.096.O._10N.286.48.B5]|nr:hypothetical protein NVP2096O_49 [Vibrio phage 2.096.O._10N.286.48.B5]
MALFKKINHAELFKNFTQYGLMYGIVPIYYNPKNHAVAVRNGIPEFVLDAVGWVYSGIESVYGLIDPDYEPTFPIKITGYIFKRVKYELVPTTVVSKYDGDVHMISKTKLKQLYRVPVRQLLTQYDDRNEFEIIELRPMFDGNYELPKATGVLK